MKVLVLGSGGREHAIVWALAKSPSVEALWAAPGNGGTAKVELAAKGAGRVQNTMIDPLDADEIIDFCDAMGVDLVVIGPEAPLVAGIADALRLAGIAVYGPDAEDAWLEGSKEFAKEFMAQNGIPTAKYESFDDVDLALQYVRDMGAPIVVKADGLAAGKGVVVAQTLAEAEDAVKACFLGAFGEAGLKVVIEECMTGPECSMLSFVTGGHSFPMAPSQDHKRAYDGDTGPNTGGMGVYSPVPIVTNEEMIEMMRVMDVAAAAVPNYKGTLYGGFMLTPEGPKIVEFNVRFGDPETQVVLPRLVSDLAEVMMSVAKGDADSIDLQWSPKWAVAVVLASAGYPGSYEKGKVISGIEDAEALDDVMVFHAGTTQTDDGQIVTSGGRVLNVVALGDSFESARDKAYAACELIDFEGKQMRTDIGARALRGRQAWD